MTRQDIINELMEIQLEHARTRKCEETGFEEYDDGEVESAKESLISDIEEDYEAYFDDLTEDDFESDVDYQNERDLRIKETINFINNY